MGKRHVISSENQTDWRSGVGLRPIPGKQVVYLSRADVEAVGLSMIEVIDLVEVALRDKGNGSVELPPKIGIHTRPNAFIHAMPAHIPSLGATGIKWVSGYPDNGPMGLPYISGLLILNAPDTGLPLSVMDATWITAIRTGAVTAVSAKYLARPESETAAILGCGVQGRMQLAALAMVCKNLQTVRAYDINADNLRRYVAEMSERLAPIAVIAAHGPEEAVRGADIIVTAGPILEHPHPTIRAEWISEGTLGAPIDFDSLWSAEALHAADLYFVDDRAQYEHFRHEEGYFQNAPPVQADLGEVVSGRAKGRETSRQRIIAMNLGLGLEDVAVAIRVYHRAIEQGIGTVLPL